MSDQETKPAIDQIQELVRRHSESERHLPPGLAEKVLEPEHAVQFDDKRYDAASYIRGLVNEALDSEAGARQ